MNCYLLEINAENSTENNAENNNACFLPDNYYALNVWKKSLIKYRNRPWFLALASLVVAFLLSPDLWIYLVQGYEGDSFYTLDALEQTGLLALTILLSGLFLVFGAIKSRFLYNYPYSKIVIPIIDLVVTSGLFYLFIWLSPQVYYSYYLIIFDDLPLQIVIKDGPSLAELGNLLSMTDRPFLSQHGQGLLGRALLIQVALYRFVLFEGSQNSK